MLDTSLSATVSDDEIRLELTVTNLGGDPVSLTFPTGQRAEFTAFDVATDVNSDVHGDAVAWRYGEDRLFTQAFGTETLEPAASATYEATWSNPPSGTYRIVGEVVADTVSETDETTVVVE